MGNSCSGPETLKESSDQNYRVFNGIISGNAELLLANLLIETEKDVDEGVNLAEQLLQRDKKKEYAYNARVVLGRGYLKQGEYARAIEILQQADDLTFVYWGECRIPLEEAKAALAKEEKK